MHVLGRSGDQGTQSITDDSVGNGPPTAHLGAFLARDGTTGAVVGIDADGPHAAMVVGKRGTGKSYTVGVIAEELAAASGVAPVIVDPMGVFGGLTAIGADVVDPVVRPSAIPPSVWPSLVGLDPERSAGSLLWRVVADAVSGSDHDTSGNNTSRATGATGTTATGTSATGTSATRTSATDSVSSTIDGPPSIADLRSAVESATAEADARRAASNHLRLAASWDIFDATAPPVRALVADGSPTVIDLAGVPERPASAVVRTVARGLYDARIAETVDRLPWLLIDEAHAFFDGVADPALRTLLTRGRAPGVSLVCATQRPGVLPPVAMSQSDLVLAHRLTAERDVARLADAEATYLEGDIAARLPTGVGEAIVVDDATEEVHTIRVRERQTPHGGGNPRASETPAAIHANNSD